MGMVASFASVGAVLVDGFRDDPEAVEAFLFPDDGEG